MSPPLLSIGEEEGQSNVTFLACSSSMESICKNGAGLKERNYMGLSDCSSVGSSTISSASEDSNVSLNLKATELRLGLPGSQSPERSPELCLLSSDKHDEKPLFPLHPVKDGNNILSQKTVVLGSKRGFTDAMNGFSEGKFVAKSEVNVTPSPMPSSNTGVKLVCSKDPLTLPAKLKDMKAEIKVQERPRHTTATNNSSNAPAPKAQVVGWPPIRSFRKSSLANTSKNTGEVDGKAGPGALFVKVSMNGAPYLRKVDLRTYSVYQDLSSALEKMFSCFIIDGSHGVSGREMLSVRKMNDLLHGSEYVLTYEDKDGDWMLVGDVPWEMFIGTCKRLRIMKSSDAIGLAPRAVEKVQGQN